MGPVHVRDLHCPVAVEITNPHRREPAVGPSDVRRLGDQPDPTLAHRKDGELRTELRDRSGR